MEGQRLDIYSIISETLPPQLESELVQRLGSLAFIKSRDGRGSTPRFGVFFILFFFGFKHQETDSFLISFRFTLVLDANGDVVTCL